MSLPSTYTLIVAVEPDLAEVASTFRPAILNHSAPVIPSPIFLNVTSSSSHATSGTGVPLFVDSVRLDFTNSKPLFSFSLMSVPSLATAPRVSPTAGSIFSSLISATSSVATSTVSLTEALMPLLSTEANTRSSPFVIVASSESTEIVAVLPLDVLSITILDRSIPITMPLSNCVAFSSLFSDIDEKHQKIFKETLELMKKNIDCLLEEK